MGDFSKLTPYSHGIVASNKKPNSRVIEVTPTEKLPNLAGELTENTTMISGSGQSKDGSSYQDTVPVAVTISAEWMPMSGEGNRQTAPDVCRGDMVMLYRFGNSKKIYWNTLNNDLKARQLETAIFAYSATPNPGEDANNDNCYVFEISGHRKIVHFHNSKANGEKVAYDILIDMGNGIFSLNDDLGQKIYIDSTAKHIELSNADASFMKMVAEAISMGCKEWSVKCTNGSIEATNLDIKAMTRQEGHYTLAGDMSSEAGGGGTGACRFSGEADFVRGIKAEHADISSNLSVGGTAHAGKVVSDQAISAPNV